MHPHPQCPRAPLQIIVVLGQVGPEPQVLVALLHANKVATLGLVVHKVAKSRHESLLGELNNAHDGLIELCDIDPGYMLRLVRTPTHLHIVLIQVSLGIVDKRRDLRVLKGDQSLTKEFVAQRVLH